MKPQREGVNVIPHVNVKSDGQVSINNSASENTKGNTPSMGLDEIKSRLSNIAEEIVAFMPPLDTPQGKDVLSSFLAELMSASERTRRERRRCKQMEGIAAAKAKGIHFGRASRPLPENFQEICQKWHDGELSLRAAAKECGMPHSSFAAAAKRKYGDGQDSVYSGRTF